MPHIPMTSESESEMGAQDRRSQSRSFVSFLIASGAGRMNGSD